MISNYIKAGRAIRPGLPYGLINFSAVSAMILIAALLNASIPLLLRDTVNAVNDKGANGSHLLFACFAYAFVWMVSGVVENLKGIFSAFFLARCDAEFNRILLNRIFRYAYTVQTKIHVGAVASEIERAAGSFSAITVSFFWSITPILIEVGFAAYVVGNNIGWIFSCVFLLGSGLIGWLSYFIALRSSTIHAELFSAHSILSAYTVERLGLLFDIRINQAHGREEGHSADILQQQVKVIRNVNKGMGLRLALISATLGILLAMAVAYLAYGTLKGKFTSGDFVLIGGYAGLLAAKLRLLAGSIIDLGRSNVALDSGLRYLDQTIPDQLRRGNSPSISRFTGFELNNMGIRFGEKLLFKPLTADIPANAMTVISGPSGIGKSTLINILIGLLPPTQGSLKICGHEIVGFTADEILEIISVAPQTAAVFAGTLKDNLEYGLPAAGSAGAIREVINLLMFGREESHAAPLLAETVIGSGGRPLSGGEKQRISIGRALLRNKEVLILDEPTASLDKTTARIMIAKIRQRVRTLIIVSHDPEIISAGDHVLNLEL